MGQTVADNSKIKKSRLKAGLILFLLIGFVTPLCKSENAKLIFTGSTFAVSFANSGVYRQNLTGMDFGVWVDAAYPISQHFYGKLAFANGFQKDFQIMAGGFVYYFNAPGVFETQVGDSINLTSYAKWRPSIEVLGGVNRTQTELILGGKNYTVNENYIGGLVKGNLTYSWDPRWEMLYTGFAGTSGGNSATVVFYGLSVGISFGLN